MEQEKKTVRKKPKPRRAPAQELIYTPPAPINRRKLLLRLATLAAVVFAVFVSSAIFFRVDTVSVSGASKYTAWSVKEASGIEEGDSLLSFGKAAAAGRIMEHLRYVKSVRIGVTLPDTVNIHIEELDVVYAAQDQADNWWLISADGRVVEQIGQSEAAEHTQFKGFRLDTPEVGESPKGWEPQMEETDPQGEVIPTLATDQERLESALNIATQLELNEILGEASKVDLTNLEDIRLWYGSRYEVKLGNPGDMDRKIAMLKTVVTEHKKEGGYQSGVLDISLTVYPDSVSYTPY